MGISEITDYQAEAGVVSTIIYHPEYILHSPHLQSQYFFDSSNSAIYWAIKELYNRKITNINALNLQQILDSNEKIRKKLQDYNLPSLQEYIELAAMSKRDSVEEYLMLVDRVVEMAFKRTFYLKIQDWERMCFNESIHLDAMSNDIYQQLNGITTQFITNGEVQSVGSYVDEVWQETIERNEHGESYGLPSFFSHLNEYFSYEKTELVVISSRMKNGKSWLALIEAIHKAQNGVPVMIIDTEMSHANWIYRALGYLSGIHEKRIKNLELSPEERREVERNREYLKTLPIFHVFDPLITNEQVYSMVAQKQIECNLGFVIYDYLKPSDDLKEPAQRSADLGAKVNFLKNRIAGGLNIPVLAFAQLNRNNEVADSDYIERYCSVSVRWEKKTPTEMTDDGPECGTHKFTVKLNRIGKCHMGDTDYIDMRFIGDRPGIVEAKQHTEKTPYD